MDVASPPTLVLVATTATEMEAASRLSYDVYIAEQGKPYPNANHGSRTWGDALDDTADVVIVLDEANCPVGTVRANSFDDPLTQRLYGELFGIDAFTPEFSLDEMVVCSRLAVHPLHRHASVRDALFESIYTHRLRQGTRLCFATCAGVLLRMFRTYGFREYAAPIVDPHVGLLHRTALVLDDVEYLQSIMSPFARLAVLAGVVPRGHRLVAARFAAMQAKYAS